MPSVLTSAKPKLHKNLVVSIKTIIFAPSNQKYTSMKKSLFIQLMVASSALMVMVACGGQGKTTTEGNDSTAVEGTEVVEEVAAPADVVKGELGMFDLRGPVKTCLTKGEGYKAEFRFDENGFVTMLNSKPLKEEYKKISRDNQGRMKHCSYDEWDETFCNYTVNEDGLLVEMEDWPYMDGGSKMKYTYNENGDLTQITVEGFDIEGGGTDVIKYAIEERDAHGNWTRRTANGKPQIRTITYYE